MTLEEITTLKEAIKRLKEVIKEVRSTIQPFLYDNEAKDYILKALEQEDILDKLDEIITDALDKSTDQKESQTLRWVLDKISEVT